jgi:hypothetical protein
MPIYIYIYIYSLVNFFIRNQDSFHTNSSVHSNNTRNNHQLHILIANLSCFQNGAFYSAIKIFNSLPQSIINLKNKETNFKATLRKFLIAHSFYSVDEFLSFTKDKPGWKSANCVNCPIISYTEKFFFSVYFCRHLTCSASYCHITNPWIYGMYVWWYDYCGKHTYFNWRKPLLWHTYRYLVLIRRQTIDTVTHHSILTKLN